MDFLHGLSAVLPYLFGAGAAAVLGVILKFYVDRERLKVDAEKDRATSDLDIEKHRDSLTIQLLETARAEVAVLKTEIDRLRPNQDHILHFEAALDHIEALLTAKPGAQRRRAERLARAFVQRMRRLALARGTLSNEVQRLASGTSLIERGIVDRGEREEEGDTDL